MQMLTYVDRKVKSFLFNVMRDITAMVPLLVAVIMRAAVEAQNCFGGIETFEKTSMTDFDSHYSPAGTLLRQPDQALTRDCVNLCKQQPTCLSFALDYTKFRCAAYSVNSIGRREHLISTNTTNYFEKVCYKGVPREEYHKVCGLERLWAYERVKNAFLDGFEESTLSNVGSKDECAKACLMETSFTCRSADYDYNNRVCRLSKEDRRTQPQAFRQVAGSSRDYLENQCVAAGPTTCVYNTRKEVGVVTMDSLVFALNLEDCQLKCDKESTFNCRSFSITDKRCFLSGDDTVSLANTLLPTKPGSVYGEKKCVTEHCVHGIFTYEKITGYVMRTAIPTPIDSIDSGKLGITGDCRQACDKAHLTCPAFTVNYQSSRCDRLDRNTQGRSLDLIPRDGENYFEKICLRVPEIMSMCQDKYWAFERVIGHEMTPVMYERVYTFVQSRRDCEEYCLQEKIFICRSALYNDETTECKLSREDRRSRPANYVRNNNPKISYLENQCIQSHSGCPMVEFENGYPTYTDLVESVGVTSKESCEKYCNDNRKFLCRSYSYYSSNGQCFISGDDHVSGGQSALQSRSGMTYYERKCDKTPDTPPTTDSTGKANSSTVLGSSSTSTEKSTISSTTPADSSSGSISTPDVADSTTTSQLPPSSSGLTSSSNFPSTIDIPSSTENPSIATNTIPHSNNEPSSASTLTSNNLPSSSSNHFPTTLTSNQQTTTNRDYKTQSFPSSSNQVTSSSNTYPSSHSDITSTSNFPSSGTETFSTSTAHSTATQTHWSSESTATSGSVQTTTSTIQTTTSGSGNGLLNARKYLKNGKFASTLLQPKSYTSSVKCGPNNKFTFERIPGFEPIGGYLMLLYSDTSNPGIVIECAKRCEVHTGCRAFVVDYNRRSCNGLFELSSIGYLDLRLSRGKDYFEGFCVPSHLTCNKLWLYDRVLDQVSVGAIPKSIIRYVHRTECRSRCLEEKRFQCLSASYDATLRECRLYDQDRHTGSLFLRFTKGTDYMENQCASETDSCRYLPIERDITITSITKSVRGSSTFFCEQECNREKDFNCRSYTYIDQTTIPGANICLLSSDNRAGSQKGSMHYRPRALYAEKDCRGNRVSRDGTSSSTTSPRPGTLRPSSTLPSITSEPPDRRYCDFNEYTFEKTFGYDLRSARRERSRMPARIGLVMQCQDECIRRGSKCQSFVIEYEPTQSCFLIDGAANENRKILSKSSQTAYFEKICLKAPFCNKLWTFERVIGYTLEETPEKEAANIETRLDCEELCLKTASCRSATYDYANKICRLFTENRRSRPLSFKPTSKEIDYLENECIKELKTCQYRDYPETFFPFIDRLSQAYSLAECQRLCNEEVLFPCRTVNYEPYTRECALCTEDRITASVGHTTLQQRRHSIYSERSACEQVSVQCNQQEMIVILNFDTPFGGRVYAKGNPAQCFVLGTGRTQLKFSISLGIKCGTRQEGPKNFANEIIIQQHPVIMTDSDRTIKVMCSFEMGDQTVTLSSSNRGKNGIDVTSLMNARTSLEHPISSVVTNTASPPTVIMRILDRSGHDAQIVGLGDELTLKIELKDTATAFALFARNLYAKSSNGESLMLIDSKGCPKDASVFPALKLDSKDHKSLVSSFKAFRFPSTGVVNFEVQIRFCQDYCEPAKCFDGTQSFGKRRRRNLANCTLKENAEFQNKSSNFTEVAKLSKNRSASHLSDELTSNTRLIPKTSEINTNSLPAVHNASSNVIHQSSVSNEKRVNDRSNYSSNNHNPWHYDQPRINYDIRSYQYPPNSYYNNQPSLAGHVTDKQQHLYGTSHNPHFANSAHRYSNYYNYDQNLQSTWRGNYDTHSSNSITPATIKRQMTTAKKKPFRPPRPLPRPKGSPVRPNIVSANNNGAAQEVPLSLAIVVGDKDKNSKDKKDWKNIERRLQNEKFKIIQADTVSTCNIGPSIIITACIVTVAHCFIILGAYFYYKRYMRYSGRKLFESNASSTENITTISRTPSVNTRRNNNANVFFGPPQIRETASSNSVNIGFRSLYSGVYGSPP
ncbi:uncharacterized protein B4U79_13044 [Dinothrombium tinctorium]|uniref:Uncharacterized protein n=1 Tax=Dinothrombium tinctorium TaxID=1965070 RepID=A0A443R8P4_9ACAR|nr:uncharacterized protein B4U79_13044 [Dinothrombium tinctorium]